MNPEIRLLYAFNWPLRQVAKRLGWGEDYLTLFVFLIAFPFILKGIASI